MLNEHPRKQLQRLLLKFGHAVYKQPKQFALILWDFCPQHKREVNLLLAALKEKVVEDLLNPPAQEAAEITLRRLAQRLHDNLGIAQEFADWAVESWALALKALEESLSHPTIADAAAPVMQKAPTTKAQRLGKYFARDDGTALDTETGLTWLRFAFGQTWQNQTVSGDVKKITWYQAFQIAKEFNQQGGYAGFTDWHVPRIDELITLIDKSHWTDGAYINTDVFPHNYQWLWSASTYPGNHYDAWVVNFSHRNETNVFKNGSLALRLVRKEVEH